MENIINDRLEIMEGMNVIDNQYLLFFFEFIVVLFYFKIMKENIIM